MEPLDVFTARDLRQRSGALFRDAEQGRLALITKHGRPALLAIPFDERLLTHGVHRAVALSLFEAHQVSLRQGAKLAGMTLEEFLELLGEVGIPAVDYPADEVAGEIEISR